MDWQHIHNMACMLLAQGWGGRLVGGGGEGDRKGASSWLRPRPLHSCCCCCPSPSCFTPATTAGGGPRSRHSPGAALVWAPGSTTAPAQPSAACLAACPVLPAPFLSLSALPLQPHTGASRAGASPKSCTALPPAVPRRLPCWRLVCAAAQPKATPAFSRPLACRHTPHMPSAQPGHQQQAKSTSPTNLGGSTHPSPAPSSALKPLPTPPSSPHRPSRWPSSPRAPSF